MLGDHLVEYEELHVILYRIGMLKSPYFKYV